MKSKTPPEYKDQVHEGRQHRNSQDHGTGHHRPHNAMSVQGVPIVEAVQVSGSTFESSSSPTPASGSDTQPRQNTSTHEEGVLCVVTKTKLLIGLLMVITIGVVIGGFCIFGRCAPSDRSSQESLADTSLRGSTAPTPTQPSMFPTQGPVEALASGEACAMDEECSSGMCARSAESPNETTKLCCISSNATIFIEQLGVTVCQGTANTGSTCYDSINLLCESGVCVDEVCQPSQLGANQRCDDSSDCLTNACALESVLWPSMKICCASGEANAALPNATACTQQPVGALCGTSNDICESGLCLNSKCAEIDNEAGQFCTTNAECIATCVANACTSSDLVVGDVCDDNDDCPFDCAFESSTQLSHLICCSGRSEFYFALGGSICCGPGIPFVAGQCCPPQNIVNGACVELVVPFAANIP